MSATSRVRSVEIEDLIDFRSIIREDRVSISPSGRYVAFTIRHDKDWYQLHIEWFATGAPRFAHAAQLLITDLETGESLGPVAPPARSWSGSWSPTEDKLLFLSDIDGVSKLWSWEAGTREASLVSGQPIFTPAWANPMQWSEDGKRICVALFSEDWKPGTDVWRVPPQPRGEIEPDDLTVEVFESPSKGQGLFLQSHLPENLPDLGQIDLVTGQAQRLLTKTSLESFAVSPDGNWLVVEEIPNLSDSGDRVSRLKIVRTSGGEARLLVDGLTHGRGGRHHPIWSPDSLHIAFVNDKKINISSPTGKPEAIATEVDIDRNFLLWTQSGKGLLAFESREVPGASFDLRGGAVHVLLDSTVVKLHSPEAGFKFLQADEDRAWSPDENSCVILTGEPDTGRSQLQKVPLDGGEPTILHTDQRLFSQYAIQSGSKSVSAGVVVFVAQHTNEPPNLWATNFSFESPRKVTNLNPNVEDARLATSRSVTWIGPEGEEIRGALFLPADYADGVRVPLVVEVYPGASPSTYLRVWDHGTLSTQLLCSRGYGVFFPDMPQKAGSSVAVTGMTDVVLSGINELVRQGIVDPDRLGVIGHSLGGYMVNRIITETTRFKAAISSAGLGNLSSMYGQFLSMGQGFASAHGQSIVGAGMGGGPWEFPLRYVAESPVFHLDKVETPLLLIHGTDDPAAGVTQPAEMFVGLRALNKKVTYLRYRSEEHVPGSFRRANRRDFLTRALAWFAEHLS